VTILKDDASNAAEDVAEASSYDWHASDDEFRLDHAQHFVIRGSDTDDEVYLIRGNGVVTLVAPQVTQDTAGAVAEAFDAYIGVYLNDF